MIDQENVPQVDTLQLAVDFHPSCAAATPVGRKKIGKAPSFWSIIQALVINDAQRR